MKLLLSENAWEAFCFCSKKGILQEVMEWWKDCCGFEQNEFHFEDVEEHILTVVRRAETLSRDFRLNKTSRIILLTSAIFHDIAKPKTFLTDKSGRRRFFNHEVVGATYAERILKSWSWPSELIEGVVKLVRLHMRPLDCGKAGVRRLRRELEDLFELWRLLKIADKPPVFSDIEFLRQLSAFDEVVASVQEVCKTRFNFSGNDLKDAGLEEGVMLGKILASFKHKALEAPECDDRELVRLLVKRFVW
jgi:putative nucleotidyltransferase with HDIG domain